MVTPIAAASNSVVACKNTHRLALPSGHRDLEGGPVRFDPMSFLLGLGVVVALPLLTKVFRPIAIEATVAGMALYDEVARFAAEQAEVVEDIVAEARAKRQASFGEAEGELSETLSE
jgi:hypothetical protein